MSDLTISSTAVGTIVSITISVAVGIAMRITISMSLCGTSFAVPLFLGHCEVYYKI